MGSIVRLVPPDRSSMRAQPKMGQANVDGVVGVSRPRCLETRRRPSGLRTVSASVSSVVGGMYGERRTLWG